MTNDRRKTFNTPAEFIIWALGSPLRVAADKHDNKYCMSVGLRGECVSYRHEQGKAEGSPFLIMERNCPLVSVQDEHGVIEEPQVVEDERIKFEGTNSRQMLGEHIANIYDPEEYHLRRANVECLLRHLDIVIDERIAAATVKENWCGDFVIKPKGE